MLLWLQIELSIVQSAMKSGHKDTATVQKERQVMYIMILCLIPDIPYSIPDTSKTSSD